MFHDGTTKTVTVSSRTAWLLTLVVAASTACGGKAGSATAADDPMSASAPPPTSPEPRAQPTVHSAGGQTIQSPRVVPIFFGSDPRETELTSFLAALPSSEYWKATTAEYGVGEIALGQTIHASGELPPTTTDLEMRQWLISRFDGTTDFPALDAPNTVYAIFLQPHTVVAAPWGRSCVDYRAYHGEAVIMGKRVAYAVIPRCGTGGSGELDSLTQSLSHELIVTVTDPYMDSHPAYALPDERSLGWTLGAGSEVTDRCAVEPAAYDRLLGGHSVARSWSNAAALAGRDPCVPAVQGTYYNAEPILPDTMTFKHGGVETKARTIQVPVGQSRTIEVRPFADGAMGEWTMDAQDGEALRGAEPELKLTFDQNTAHPGDIRHLTIERLKASSTGATPFAIHSHSGSGGHHWWGVASN